MPELSILGIKAGSTLHDIFKIFGKPEEYFTDTLTYEIMIDGVSTRVYMSLGEQYGTKVVKSMIITFFYEK